MKNIFFSVAILFVMVGESVGQESSINKITDKKITKSIVVPHSLDSTWWKWTTHEGLLTFFGKGNKVDFKIDGAYEIYFSMEPPYGTRGTEGCTVLSYLPKQMLSFSWIAPPKFKEARDGGTKLWVVVQLKSLAEKSTKVTVTQYGFPEGKVWDDVRMYFEGGWGMVLQWLKESK